MPSFLQVVLDHRIDDLPGFVPVYAFGEQIGWTKRDFAETLVSSGSVWKRSAHSIALSEKFDNFDAASENVHHHLSSLSEQGILPPLPDYSQAPGGNDWFPVGDKPLFQIRRFYSRYLGILNHSVKVNGFENDHYWAAIRSANVTEGKNAYDVIVAGAVKIGQTVEDTIFEEGAHECGLRQEDLKHLKPAQMINLCYLNRQGFLANEIFHIYDYDTENLFTPRVVDLDEVAGFERLPVSEMMRLVEQTDKVRPQICFVLIDFFLRHGYLTKDHPDYDQIMHHMTKSLPNI